MRISMRVFEELGPAILHRLCFRFTAEGVIWHASEYCYFVALLSCRVMVGRRGHTVGPSAYTSALVLRVNRWSHLSD